MGRDGFHGWFDGARLKLLRYGGLGGIILIAFIALVSWRNAEVTPDGETAVLVGPLLDGPANAPIKVVEYADLTCSACRQWHNLGVKEQLRAEFGNQISFEYRHFPVITASSPNGAQAAQYAARLPFSSTVNQSSPLTRRCRPPSTTC